MGVLIMLLTIGGVAVAALLFAAARFLKMVWLSRFVSGAVAVWLAVYAVMLFSFSLTSKEKVLAFNEPKAFCGFYLDCHMHTAVTGVRKIKRIGNKTADGDFYVVKVKVFSDASRAELNLWNPNFIVTDAQGRRFERIADLEKPEPSWEQKVSAGDAFEKEIIFDLPVNAETPRLDVSEGIGIDKAIESILIDDEDSLFHQRQVFSLNDEAQTADLYH